MPASVEPIMTAVSSRQFASVRFSMSPIALRVMIEKLRAARYRRSLERDELDPGCLGRLVPYHYSTALT